MPQIASVSIPFSSSLACDSSSTLCEDSRNRISDDPVASESKGSAASMMKLLNVQFSQKLAVGDNGTQVLAELPKNSPSPVHPTISLDLSTLST